MRTLKELKGKLKKKGAKKEDIKIALVVLRYLVWLDGLIFPGNTAIVNFAVGKYRHGFFASHRLPSKQNEARYNIYVNGLAESLREEKKKRGLWIPNLKKGSKNRSKLLRPTWEELLVPVAAHEVRHRVQYDCSCKKFSPSSANLVKDRFLKAIIEFNGFEFKERIKIYDRDGESKRFIKSRINRKEFDAEVIGGLIAAKIHGKSAYILREEIVSIIKMPAP